MDPMRRATWIALFAACALQPAASQPYPHPCAAQMAQCQQDAGNVAAPGGGYIPNPMWAEAGAVQSTEQAKCHTNMINCFGGKDGCNVYSDCVGGATQCLQSAAAKAYTRFNTAGCDSYVLCMREANENLCLYQFGYSFLLPGQVVTACDPVAICSKASEGARGCQTLTKAECDGAGDCEWHWGSMACWEEEDSARRLMESICINIAAVLLWYAYLWFFYYLFIVRPKQNPPSFQDPYSKDQVDYLQDMGPVPGASQDPLQDPSPAGSPQQHDYRNAW